jgi:hypothetical protein
MNPWVDRAHLAAPLAVDQGESSWVCAELVSNAPEPRRLAVLAWLHRTGPRLERFDAGPGLVDKNLLPARLRDALPSWLPIITPVSVRADDRPLLLVALYDLDSPDQAPLAMEETIEHADFDAETFSGRTRRLSLRIEADRMVIEAKSDELDLSAEGRPLKPAVQFGETSPTLRHGEIEIGYLQRPRLAFTADVSLRGEAVGRLTGEGAHDRHWRKRSTANLAWLWLHLRLPGSREINCYVLRDSRAPFIELARRCWLVDEAGEVRLLPDFELVAESAGYRFEAPALGLQLRFAHAVRKPYLRLGAFGGAISAGIEEGPIRRLDAGPAVGGWLEVFDSSDALVVPASASSVRVGI